jgi:hypothetical protein
MIHDDENVTNPIIEIFIYSICASNPLLGGNPIIRYNGLRFVPIDVIKKWVTWQQFH